MANPISFLLNADREGIMGPQEWQLGDESISQLEHIIDIRKIGSWKSYLWEWSGMSYNTAHVAEIFDGRNYVKEQHLIDGANRR